MMLKAQSDPGLRRDRIRSLDGRVRHAPSPRRGRVAALNLGAVVGAQQNKRLRVPRLRGLAGAGMGALGTIVLGGGIDAVAFLELVLGHAGHVVLDNLRRIAGALARTGGACIASASPMAVDRAEAANRRWFMIQPLLERLGTRPTGGGSMHRSEGYGSLEEIFSYARVGM
jgi:hypothetical protein